MSDIAVGYYRHWKGGLYEVEVSDAQDANADQLAPTDTAGRATGDAMDERHVVIYRSVSDGSYWVRTVEDFLAVVHTEDGSTCAGELCNRVVGQAFADRFTYLGTELTGEMLSE